jgi:hypothetical protein
MDDKAAVIAEILEAIQFSERRPGDVDKIDIAAQIGVNISTVPSKMQPLVDAGTFETMKVYDPVKRREVRIWRKLNEPRREADMPTGTASVV